MVDKYERVDVEARRDFLKALGIAGAAATGAIAVEEFTLADLQGEVNTDSTALAAAGQAIQDDLTGSLDAGLIESELAGLTTAINQVPAVRDQGIPATRDAAQYGPLAEPGWALHDHFADVGLYDAAETHLPLFSVEHVTNTATELIESGSFAALLDQVGFEATEQTALMANVVNNQEHLERWLPTEAYPAAEYGMDDEAIDPETVPPVHHRSIAGTLLWIDALDHWLWQQEILLTEQILDDAAWGVQSMLAGNYLLANAAYGIATEDITDEALSALVTMGSGVAIVSQFEFTNDVMWITEDMRAPQEMA